MTAITTRLTVAPDGVISSAAAIPAGEYIASLEPGAVPTRQRAPLPFDVAALPQLDLGPWPWPPGTTFGRDELYGDDGR